MWPLWFHKRSGPLSLPRSQHPLSPWQSHWNIDQEWSALPFNWGTEERQFIPATSVDVCIFSLTFSVVGEGYIKLNLNHAIHFYQTSSPYTGGKRKRWMWFSYFAVTPHIKAMPASVSHPSVLCKLKDQGPRAMVDFQTGSPTNQLWGRGRSALTWATLE